MPTSAAANPGSPANQNRPASSGGVMGSASTSSMAAASAANRASANTAQRNASDPGAQVGNRTGGAGAGSPSGPQRSGSGAPGGSQQGAGQRAGDPGAQVGNRTGGFSGGGPQNPSGGGQNTGPDRSNDPGVQGTRGGLQGRGQDTGGLQSTQNRPGPVSSPGGGGGVRTDASGRRLSQTSQNVLGSIGGPGPALGRIATTDEGRRRSELGGRISGLSTGGLPVGGLATSIGGGITDLDILDDIATRMGTKQFPTDRILPEKAIIDRLAPEGVFGPRQFGPRAPDYTDMFEEAAINQGLLGNLPDPQELADIPRNLKNVDPYDRADPNAPRPALRDPAYTPAATPTYAGPGMAQYDIAPRQGLPQAPLTGLTPYDPNAPAAQVARSRSPYVGGTPAPAPGPAMSEGPLAQGPGAFERGIMAAAQGGPLADLSGFRSRSPGPVVDTRAREAALELARGRAMSPAGQRPMAEGPLAQAPGALERAVVAAAQGGPLADLSGLRSRSPGPVVDTRERERQRELARGRALSPGQPVMATADPAAAARRGLVPGTVPQQQAAAPQRGNISPMGEYDTDLSSPFVQNIENLPDVPPRELAEAYRQMQRTHQYPPSFEREIANAKLNAALEQQQTPTAPPQYVEDVPQPPPDLAEPPPEYREPYVGPPEDLLQGVPPKGMPPELVKGLTQAEIDAGWRIRQFTVGKLPGQRKGERYRAMDPETASWVMRGAGMVPVVGNFIGAGGRLIGGIKNAMIGSPYGYQGYPTARGMDHPEAYEGGMGPGYVPAARRRRNRVAARLASDEPRDPGLLDYSVTLS